MRRARESIVHFIKSTGIQLRILPSNVPHGVVKASRLSRALRAEMLIKQIGRGICDGVCKSIDRSESQGTIRYNTSVVERRIYEPINGLRVNDSAAGAFIRESR